MITKIIQTITVALVISSTGCGYNEMSSEEAIRYQSEQLINTTTRLYASKPSIPDGDITKIIVAAGGAMVTTPDVYTEDSIENIRDRDAMLRLNANQEAGSISNEFGGNVKIIVKDGKPTLVYTKVPSTVSCEGIAHVVCEHS